MLYNDHPGSAPGTQAYAPAPRFTVTENDEAARQVYLAQTAADDARIYLERMGDAVERAARWKATDEQLEDLKRAASDCEQALAAVIAKLCREPDFGRDERAA